MPNSRLGVVVLAALAVFATSACELQSPEETTLFEHAELSYARGDYDGASQLFREFLELHPHSPLADTAQHRLDIIDRELDAIMGRRGSPAPIYVHPFAPHAVTRQEPEAFAPVAAPEIPTLGE
ncbi:MAG: hypothetical protein H6700_11625 [Myxococcales bacterium]|nr:hypothetical protein [Myxococcales bacterium]MCB9521602.1 hypothetical protein [Myxococcales bacterium]MCB9532408.1 hypothetical protein [Myxococcales bacterium]